jgi:hypothetical protein
MARPQLWSLGTVFLTFVSLAVSAPARRARQPRDLQREWVHLGARQIDLRADHDVLRTVGEDRFKHVRLVVEGGDLEMFDVRFTFGDGATFSPAGRFSFKGKSRSRVLSLPGAARIIRWIDFYYRNLQNGAPGRATVHLYGRR